MAGLEKTLRGHTHWVYSVAISRDARWLASGSKDNTVRIWDAETGECKHTLQGHTGWVRSVAISRDARWLASGSWDNTVRIWGVELPYIRERRILKEIIQTKCGNLHDILELCQVFL